MANCSQLEIWNPIAPGSKFCAESSADDSDYNSGVRIVPAHGPATQFTKVDLDPGPSCKAVGDKGYGCRVTVRTGAGATKATLHAWTELNGVKTNECTWTVSGASTEKRATIVLVPA
jgi:hypothetical protein